MRSPVLRATRSKDDGLPFDEGGCMKRLVLGVLLAVLCGAPGASRADVPGAVTAPAANDRHGRAASNGEAYAAEAETSEYAAREEAAPQLEEFAGGQRGVYIGSGALLVALIVVLLLAL
jgi:hypothetical protein